MTELTDRMDDIMTRKDKYILEGREIVPVDLMTWAKWFEENFNNRRIAQDQIGPFFVSTVFLGIDHRFIGEGPPIVFETMVFDMRGNERQLGEEVGQWRYETYDQAERGHQIVADHARKAAASDGAIWPGDPSMKEAYEEEEDNAD